MDLLDLTDYRERVARIYLADTDLATFRRQRDELFATHPQSAIPTDDHATFAGLRYFPENPDARVTVPIRPADGTTPASTSTPAAPTASSTTAASARSTRPGVR